VLDLGTGRDLSQWRVDHRQRLDLEALVPFLRHRLGDESGERTRFAGLSLFRRARGGGRATARAPSWRIRSSIGGSSGRQSTSGRRAHRPAIGFENHDSVIGAQSPAGSGSGCRRRFTPAIWCPAFGRRCRHSLGVHEIPRWRHRIASCSWWRRSRSVRKRAAGSARGKWLCLTAQERRQGPERHDRQQDDKLKHCARPTIRFISW